MKFTILLLVSYFSILSLAPNLQGAQFFKLPEVISHFNSHQKSDESFSSFIDFLTEHYFNNHHKSDDEKNLPFKTVSSSSIILTVQNGEDLKINLAFLPLDKDKSVFGEPENQSYSSSFSVWNPPKMI